jgi:hypothetical protein
MLEMDDLIDWFQQAEQQICSAEFQLSSAACVNPELAKQQLKNQRSMDNEVEGKKFEQRVKLVVRKRC